MKGGSEGNWSGGAERCQSRRWAVNIGGRVGEASWTSIETACLLPIATAHQAWDESRRDGQMWWVLRESIFYSILINKWEPCVNGILNFLSGASDPYVKIKCAGRLLHKSRTVHRDLNPVWDESVTLPIEDPFQPLNIKVREPSYYFFQVEA